MKSTRFSNLYWMTAYWSAFIPSLRRSFFIFCPIFLPILFVAISGCTSSPNIHAQKITTEITQESNAKTSIQPLQAWHYEITMHKDLSAHVDVCWQGSDNFTEFAKKFVAAEEKIKPYFSYLKNTENKIENKIENKQKKQKNCLQYQVDLRRAGQEIRDRDFADIQKSTTGEMWIGSGASLLLWPQFGDTAQGRRQEAECERRCKITATWHMPAGFHVMTPWPVDESSQTAHGDQIYTLGFSILRRQSYIALGYFPEYEIEIGSVDQTTTTKTKSKISVAILAGDHDASDAGILDWLSYAAQTVAAIRQEYPVPRATVLVVPSLRGGGIVPFGMVVRGGGPTATLFLADNAQDDALRGEWVAIHEMSHLLFPMIDREDAWMPEGMATYYQTVARGKSGFYNEQQVWSALCTNIKAATTSWDGRSIQETSQRMRQEFNYRDVYWLGTAFFLWMDIQLRQQGSSLDAHMAKLADPENNLRMDEEVYFDDADLIDVLDRRNHTTIWHESYVQYIVQKKLPPLENLWRQLGVSDDCQSVAETGDLLHIRREITKKYEKIPVKWRRVRR